MKKLISFTVFAALFTVAQVASAVIIWDFGTEFSGSGSSLSGTVRVTVDDGGTPGSVDVTIDTSLPFPGPGLDPTLSEYVAGLYLNVVSPANALVFSFDGGSIDPINPISQGVDQFQADGDGLYDIRIDYSASPPRFIAGLTDTITFTRVDLVEGDFNVFSAPGPGGNSGPFVAALRARSLDADGQGSGWFFPEGGGPPGQIPEPGILALFGIGLLAVGGTGIRRRQRAAV